MAGGAEAQTAWRAAHVEPFANLDCALCFHRADGRVLALATRPTVNGLETWELGRSGWYRRAPTQSPPARTAAALGYDAARRVIVLFGGLGSYGANLLDDTWEWDSVGWTNRTPANAPPARNSAAAAFDEPRGVFVVFGGMGALGTLGDQWQWNGIAWTQDPLAGGSPGPRLGALMAFDRGRDRLVLFGGAGSSGAYDNDIWEHDGATWSPVSATGRPPKLRSASITFDARRGRTVIYGGRSGGILSPSVVNTDVFEWDGSVWRAFASANGPGERLNAGFACDERTGELVLHGGAFTGGTFRCEPTTHTWSPSLPAAPERAAIGVAANDLAGRTLYHTPYGTHRWDHARQRW
ncbi:MAG: hypothetical protein KDE27_14360, partial [Planctomycetes bacterium]|nr:hypothetical protein [Planctomycetota bacterium]